MQGSFIYRGEGFKQKYLCPITPPIFTELADVLVYFQTVISPAGTLTLEVKIIQCTKGKSLGWIL